MRFSVLIFIMLLSTGGFAAKQKGEFGFDASLAVVSIPFPMGKGVGVYYKPSPYFSASMSYLSSSIAIDLFSFHLAELKESNFFLKTRYYPSGKSFNFLLGGGKRKLEATFSSDLFQALTSPSETASEISSNILHLGLGNEWYWKNRYKINVDWFTVNIPVYGQVGVSASRFGNTDKDIRNIRHAESSLRWVPTGSFITATFGIYF